MKERYYLVQLNDGGRWYDDNHSVFSTKRDATKRARLVKKDWGFHTRVVAVPNTGLPERDPSWDRIVWA